MAQKNCTLTLSEKLRQSNIKMGRDRFLEFCRNNHLLVPKTRRSFITTDSKHRYHKSPNLIKDLAVTYSEQVFVSDITYIKLEDKHAYLALVTDLYSKKIMGYKLDDNMKTSLVKEALQMALNNKEHQPRPTPSIIATGASNIVFQSTLNLPPVMVCF